MSWFSKLFGQEEPAPNAEAFVEKAQAYIESERPPAEKSDNKSRIKFSMRDNYSRDNIRSAVKSAARGGRTNWDLLSRDLSANLNVGFVEELEELIWERDLKDSTVYKAAQIDRRLFSKIMSDRSYKPAKDTCVAIALALELPLTKFASARAYST